MSVIVTGGLRFESSARHFFFRGRNHDQFIEIAIHTLKLCNGIVGGRPAKICLKDKIAQKRKKEPQPIESGPQVDKDKKQKKNSSTFKKKDYYKMCTIID